MPLRNQELIVASIERIIFEGGKSNFVILNISEDYFLQAAASRGDHAIWCEAVSNNFIEPEALLTESQIQHLQQLGWNLPESEEDNFQVQLAVDSEQRRAALADLFMRTANSVYGVEGFTTEMVHLNLE